MSRPERRVRVTVSLAPNVVRLLDRAARAGRGRRSRSQIVERCVLEAVGRGKRAALRDAIDAYYAHPGDETDTDPWRELAAEQLHSAEPW